MYSCAIPVYIKAKHGNSSTPIFIILFIRNIIFKSLIKVFYLFPQFLTEPIMIDYFLI